MNSFPSFVRSSWLPTALVLGAAVSLALSGCARKKDPVVSGKVLYGDKPVTGGTVSFVPTTTNLPKEQAGPFPGTISPQGTYTISGVPKGEYVVTVETDSVKAASQGYAPLPAGVKSAIEPPTGNPNGPKYVEIPPRYKDAHQSTLKLTVTGGHQSDADLKLIQ
jgi:hypothetical protein